MSDFYAKFRADTTQLVKDLKTVAAQQTFKVKVQADGAQVRELQKEVMKVVDSEGKMTTVTNTLNKKTGEFNQTLKESAKTAKTWSEEFSDSFQKVLRFGSITAIIGAFSQAFKEAVQTVKEFDDALTEFKKVSDLSGESLDSYTKKLGELGQEVARTRTEMVSSATEFVKSGYSEEDAAQLAKISELYRNIADEAISSGDSANFIISQMKAFSNNTEEFALHTINAINNVSNNMAVSSSDISTALSKTSSAMGALGNTYEQTVALVTSGTEIMQGQASKVSRGLRTIGNNIANVAQSSDTLEISVQGVTKQIDLLDSTTGDMRSTFDIMQDIFTNGWEDMSNAEKQALAISLAGKNQFEVFVSVLENFADAQKAVVLATNSAESAEKENEAYLDSLGAKLNQTKALLQELVLGNGGLEKFGKKLLDVGIAILKFANSDIGQLIIKSGLLITAVTAVNKAFLLFSTTKVATYLSNVGTAFSSLTTEIIASGDAATAFKVVLETLKLDPIILAITGVVTAGYGLYKLVGYLNPSIEKLNENVKNANSEYKQTTGNIDSIKETLKTINSQIDSIRSKDKIELTDQKQLEMLQKEQASLEQQLLLQEELQRTQRDEATKAGEKVLSKGVYDAGAFGVDMGTGEVQTGTSSEALVSYTNQINELQQQLEPLLQQKQALEDANKQESQEYAELRDRIVELTKKQDSARSAAVNYAQTIEEATENADDSNEKIKEGIDALDGYYDALKNVDGKSHDTSDNMENLGNKTEESNEDLEEGASKAEQLASAWEAWNSSIDNIQSAYNTLSSAVEEYNTQGGYSLDTLQALLALDPAYLSALQEENGQMTLNTEIIKQKIEAQANEAKQIIYKTAMDKLATLSGQQSAESTQEAGNASANAVDQHNANAQAISGEAKASMVLAAANSAIGKGASKVDVNKVLSEMNQQLKAVDSWVDSVGKDFSKSMGTATKSTNKATGAVNKQSQALQNAKKALQSERDAKIKEVETQLKELEKQYNAEKKRIEDERDARKKYWEEQLSNLEAQNKAVEDGIELQEKLNALAVAQQTKKMVFKDGRFVYESDESATSEAQSELDELNRQKEYEDQKAYLERLRDKEDELYEDMLNQLKEHYEEEKERLEEYKNQIKDNYDQQIEDLENHKESIQGQYNQMLDNQNAYQDSSLASAQNYVSKYNSIMRGLSNGSVISVNKSENIKVGGKTTSTSIAEALKGGSQRRHSNAKSTGDNYVNGYASGVNGVNDSELSVVGENPKYREIVIGSKLNNDQGTVMALKRGSGVVNAKATNTLASLFNAFTSQRSVGQAISNSDNHATTIEIGSISLPQVTDGKSFISYLQNFKTDLTQRAFKR